MSAAPKQSAFHCKVEESDAAHEKATTVRCTGRLTSASAEELKQTVKPLIARGGRILIDFAGLDHMDSSGLGAVVGLKVSSLNKPGTSIELIALSPRIRQLLSLTNLAQMFNVPAYPGTDSAFNYHEAALHKPPHSS